MIEYQVTRARDGMAVGQALAVDAAVEVMALGGNAVDAAVAAGLVSGVVAPSGNGIGGYGGSMVIALRRTASGRQSIADAAGSDYRVTVIDFNSAAPMAARHDMFADEWYGDGDTLQRGGRHVHGPLAVGVPGTLAGLQLALDRCGTRSFRELVRPAIDYCLNGFPTPPNLANASQNPGPSLSRFPETMALLRPDGRPVREGETVRNPDLGCLLETLADRGRVDSFYDGDIGRRIADYVRAHGGLLTAADMATYRAREVAPLTLDWRGFRIYAPPLTAGSLTVLQALRALAVLGWERADPSSPETYRMLVETARAVWHDRLALLGDPEHGEVPVARLLSDAHAEATAARVRAALQAGRRIEARTEAGAPGGTVHMSFADAAGNAVALTQTHGGGFGSHVTVAGLGLTLGHGMSRFTPQPGHPNSPGPGKRALHNMCPTIVFRDGAPVLVAGGHGGRRIVNALLHVLLHFAGRGASIGEALAASRFHTEGGDVLWTDRHFPDTARDDLRNHGYDVQEGGVASTHGIQIDPATGEMIGLTEPRHAGRGSWGVAVVKR